MTTEILKSLVSEADVNENKINYLWLNGERVIGIEGLQIFEDCRQLEQSPAIKKEEVHELNSIINTLIEKGAEEGICNDWPSLIISAKNYLSKIGYCVNYLDKVTIDLREPVKVNFKSLELEKTSVKERIMTGADLWKIYQARKVRQYRRFL